MKSFLLLLVLFLVVKAEYNETLGKYLGQLTVASYCIQGQINSWNCLPCKRVAPLKFVHVFKNRTNDTCGYIGVSDNQDAVILVLRGTLPWDIKNWISDINFLKRKYALCDNGCEVHRGFYEDWLDIAPAVRDLVNNYTKTFDKKYLYVTGHSLGGALSTHAVADLISHGFKVDQYYSLGSPRVGDKQFSEWFDKIWGDRFKARVTHYRDPAPHLPFELWGFHHVATEVYYNQFNTAYKICDPSGEDKNCANQIVVTDVIDHLSYYSHDYVTEVALCQ